MTYEQNYVAEDKSQATTGKWDNEPAAASEFDRLAAKSGAFQNSYQEVSGQILQPRLGAQGVNVRLDRILTPSRALLDAGWPHGPIGVEIKKSNMKLGPIVTQVLDYQHSVFEILPGYHVWLEWIFIWPAASMFCDLASIAANNRIGSVNVGYNDSLRFVVGCTVAINTAGYDGKIFARPLKFGRRSGSRSGNKKTPVEGD